MLGPAQLGPARLIKGVGMGLMPQLSPKTYSKVGLGLDMLGRAWADPITTLPFTHTIQALHQTTLTHRLIPVI